MSLSRNRYGRIAALCLLGWLHWAFAVTASVNVVTYHNDNARTGFNGGETVLTPLNVNTNTFGRLFTQTVDGYVYAQPLVVTGVSIPGKGTHDVVYIATEHDTVYAFDADSNTGSNALPLWTNSFVNPAAGVTTLSSASISCSDIVPEIGISSTPVIDPVTGTLYVEAKTVESSNNATYFVHRLHALDLATGAEKFGGPVVIQGSANGATFNPLTQMNQAALLLKNGVVYIGFSSHCDIGAYYGWLFGYGAQSLALSNIFNVTPHGYGGTIWEAGGGPAADTNGGIFFTTGRGTYDGGSSQDYANSFLKLSATNGLAVVSSFTPYNQSSFGALDFGTGGGLLLPDDAGSSAHPHLMVGAGAGKVYLVDRDNMGGFNGSSDSQIVQSFGVSFGQCFDTPAYFNHTLYFWGTGSLGDYLRAFTITNGLINATPVASSPTAIGYPGATCTVSANGGNNGIVWAVDASAYGNSGPAVLHAYSAANVGTEIYNSGQVAGDVSSPAVKFSVPTVANAHVYVGGQYSFSVYGITGILPAPTPAIVPGGGLFTNSISVTITDAAPTALIFYTLDGTAPGTNSFLYSAPFNLTNSLELLAIAVSTGFSNSLVATATFTNYVPTAATPAIIPSGGLFTNSISITITDATPGAIIYYTLDGTTPTTASAVYGGSIIITNSLLIQAVAVLAGEANSSVASALFTQYLPAAAVPAIIPNGGLFTNSISITITDAMPGVVIYYTLDGSTPTTASAVYGGSIIITNSLTVQAVAVLAGFANSSLASASFTKYAPITSVNVLTYHYDNARSGLNPNETVLTPQNVNTNTFGRLFTQPVDGYVYAQPLIVTGVSIPGKGVHDVVYIATEHDTVYAFDADSNTGSNSMPLWTNSFVNAAAGVTTLSSASIGCSDIVPEIGISSTPVIDPATGTIFVEANTVEMSNSVAYNIHRLHALDIQTGAEKFGGPVMIQATVAGTGNGADVSGHISFTGVLQMNRPALLLNRGVVYLAYASHCVLGNFHGWLFGFDAHTLASSNLFMVTPNGHDGGIWQGGCGPAADAGGDLFMMTGNGTYDANQDYGDTFLRLTSTNGLRVATYFTPQDQANLDQGDLDLGSGGAMLLPDEAGSLAHPHLAVGAGKESIIFLVDRDNMGGYNPYSNGQIVESLSGLLGGECFDTPAYFNHTLYYCVGGDFLRAFTITNAFINPAPQAVSPSSFWWPGATPSVSANGTNSGIVWAVDSGHYAGGGAAILRAFNATNVAVELYNTSQTGGPDVPGAAVKYSVPTVANGRVYLGVEYGFSVYGLTRSLPAPVIAPAGGIFGSPVSITITDAVAAAAIYFTTNGAAPTTSSLLYIGPFTISNSVTIQARAFQSGSADSPFASASFSFPAAPGNGIGLLGAYYTNHTSANPFTGAPVLVQTNPGVNFNWGTTGPSPLVGATNFTVRWTGMIQPQFTEPYRFYLTNDDGVRLYLNGQLVINDWNDKTAPTVISNTVALAAQQFYNIELDYYQKGGNASVALAWTSPSTPLAAVPSSQLFPYTNPPPAIALVSPTNNASYTAAASVTMSATASASVNALGPVQFFTNGVWAGSVTNPPYTLTVNGLAAGGYTLTASAAASSGLAATSAPVQISVIAGSGQPYGLTNVAPVPAFFNLPTTYNGSLPALLSLTGIFSNTPGMLPAPGLIPYLPNTPLWSDGALKTRYLAVPNAGGNLLANEQITFSPTGSWTFPPGTVFVKTFELNTDTGNPNVRHRLETRLLVCDTNGGVYGVTYKWRADNSDADLLAGSLTENIAITNSTGITTQAWYYPSPGDCLTCHTPVAKYVLGLNTRQLNNVQTYAGSSVTDNQLRALNRAGLLNPAFDEAAIAGFEKLSSLTNSAAPLQERVRSYLDANCAQCHQPGGTGPTFDARYDTPFPAQNLTNYPATFPLGYNHAMVIKPQDIWRSVIYDRMNSTNPAIKMPPLARNLIDTNGVAVLASWINTLPGLPALAPPVISPTGGIFFAPVNVTLQAPDSNAAVYFTVDGSLPTTQSLLYTNGIGLASNAVITAVAYETNFDSSVPANAAFAVYPLSFIGGGYQAGGTYQMEFAGAPGSNYVLLASTNLMDWTPLVTNPATTNLLYFTDPAASNYPNRFYRVEQH
jgi:uncharacterized repeat protein (TIGR03806 family)